MGFGRGVGYFFSIILIILGFAALPLSIVLTIFGILFIVVLKQDKKHDKELKRSVELGKTKNELELQRWERLERQLKQAEEDRKRELEDKDKK